MTQAEYDLLLRLEAGPAVLHPTEPGPEGREAFQWMVVRLLDPSLSPVSVEPMARRTSSGQASDGGWHPLPSTAARVTGYEPR